jgi:hypothetical protein
MKSDINNKPLDLRTVHVAREGGERDICSFQYARLSVFASSVRKCFCVLSFHLIIYVLIRYLHFAHFPCTWKGPWLL